MNTEEKKIKEKEVKEVPYEKNTKRVFWLRTTKGLVFLNIYVDYKICPKFIFILFLSLILTLDFKFNIFTFIFYSLMPFTFFSLFYFYFVFCYFLFFFVFSSIPPPHTNIFLSHLLCPLSLMPMPTTYETHINYQPTPTSLFYPFMAWPLTNPWHCIILQKLVRYSGFRKQKTKKKGRNACSFIPIMSKDNY